MFFAVRQEAECEQPVLVVGGPLEQGKQQGNTDVFPLSLQGLSGSASAWMQRQVFRLLSFRPFGVPLRCDFPAGLSHMLNSKPKAFHRDIKSANILLVGRSACVET